VLPQKSGIGKELHNWMIGSHKIQDSDTSEDLQKCLDKFQIESLLSWKKGVLVQLGAGVPFLEEGSHTHTPKERGEERQVRIQNKDDKYHWYYSTIRKM
jgi:hypothetical protein